LRLLFGAHSDSKKEEVYMRKVCAFLSASLCLSLVTAAKAQAPAADMFKDVPSDHWAYQAVENLRKAGIVIGYPDGYFRGKRTLTRYEFAVALDRALAELDKRIKGLPTTPRDITPQKGDKGDKGDKGEPGPPGPPGVTPEELANLRRLATEFRDELAALGNNMRAVMARLDQLAKEIADLRARIDRMPVIGGNVFAGFRGDIANGNYVDHDGYVNPLGSDQAVVHAYRLTVDANIPGGGTVSAGITADNYKNFRNGNIAQVGPRPQGLNLGPVTGHNSGSLTSAVAGDTYLDTLEIKAPFSGIGRNSALTVGRIPQRLGRLVLWRPDTDTYFNVPWLEDGNYRIDGARLTTNFGSVGVEAFGGQFKSVQGTNMGPWNSPLAGTAIDPGGTRIFEFNAKPIGQPTLGQMTVTEAVGVSAGIGLRQLLQGGHLRVSAMETEGTGGGGFTGVEVLGADADLRLSDRITLTGDWGKTITHTGRTRTVWPHFNNAFNAALGFGFGNINISAGYRYIDPHFYAPGYWGRIGNWLNPTNVQGPTGRLAWDMGALTINLGGDWYQAARDRGSRGGMGADDQIVRALAGIRWNLSRVLNVSADWEGVYWTIEGAHSVTPAGGAPSLTTPATVGGSKFIVHPTEHYVTLGAGYNLTTSTLLKLMYQIGAYDGHNLLLGAPGIGPRYSFNVVAGQVAVKF